MPALKKTAPGSDRLPTARRLPPAILAVLLLAGTGSMGRAGAATPSTGIVVGARSLDLGRVAPLARIPWTVRLTNATASVLEISNLRTTCSCVVPAWRKQTVPPGGGTTLDLQLIVSGVPGPLEEALEFDSSNPDEPRVRIEVRGEVYRAVEAIPEFAMLPVTPDAWQGEKAVVRIVNHEASPMELSGPRSLHPAFDGRLEVVRPGFEYLLEMWTTRALPNGNHYGRFELATSSSNAPRLEVTAFVPGLPAVALGPRSLRLPGKPGPGVTSGPVYIRSTTAHILELRAAAPPAGTRILLNAVETGRLYRLELVTESGFRMPAVGDLGVDLESNHAAHRTLRIPVSFAEPATNSATVNGGR